MALFGEYTILKTINPDGGEAIIYKVRHNEWGDIKALRVPKTSIKSEEDEAFLKFKDECKKLLRLSNHPNIVKIYRPRFWKEPDEDEGKAYVEMEFVDGKDLLKHLSEDEQNFVPIEDVLRMAEQISSALAYCHVDVYADCMNGEERNEVEKAENEEKRKTIIDKLIKDYRVVHNDIHSNNIIRRKNGDYVLLDFGLAFDGKEVVRSTKMKGGVIQFMAPEKLEALLNVRKLEEKDLTPQLDIYGFGVVLYEYLAGELPNVDSDIGLSIFNSRKQYFEKKYKKEYVKDYPDWLEAVIVKCLQKDPAKRYKDGKALHDCILKKANGEGSDDDDEDIGEGGNKSFFVIALVLLICGIGAYFGFFREVKTKTRSVPRFEIIVKSYDPQWGIAIGGGLADSLEVVTIKAVANKGCQFVKWNDGNTDSIRIVVADRDQKFIAFFKEKPKPRPVPRFEITVKPNNPDWGMVIGGNDTYDSLSIVTIEAIEKDGYQFIKWSDGNKERSREVIIVCNQTFVAEFEKVLPVEKPGKCIIQYSFGRYEGKCKNGIPEGRGIMYYNCRIQIAKYSLYNIFAEQGDYFEGNWKNGDIYVGNLYDKNGIIKYENIKAKPRNRPYDLEKNEYLK